jgi:hypothetical protein
MCQRPRFLGKKMREGEGGEALARYDERARVEEVCKVLGAVVAAQPCRE